MQTKHLIIGTAGLAFVGLVAHTALNDNRPEIPENMNGEATLVCKGMEFPVIMSDSGPLPVKEDAIEVDDISLKLNFNSGKVIGWSSPPRNDGKRGSPSNLALVAEEICAINYENCTPKTNDSPNGKTTNLFEYAYLLEQETEDREVVHTNIKGTGLLSQNFDTYIGLHEKNGSFHETSMSCEIVEVRNSLDIR